MILTKKQTILIYILLIISALALFFPILFSVGLSFCTNKAIVNGNYFPTSINFENYANALKAQPLMHYMKNSLITASLLTTCQIIIALLSSYALVFLNFKWKNVIFTIFMATMMIPSEVLVISNFQLIRSMNLLNTFLGLMLPSMASTFGIFLLRQNLKQIPWELKEASQIAGISDFKFFIKVAIPMVKNSIVTLAIYYFLVSWNSYMWPLLSTTNTTVRTVQIGLRQLKVVDGSSDFAMMAAGAIMVSLPTLLLIFFAQKRLQEGLSRGALK